MRSIVQVNDSKASFKIVSASSDITTETQFNSATEVEPEHPVYNEQNSASLVKVVVKAEDGTVKIYTVGNGAN
ncbi:hypothetical protein [Bacillus mesophilum]|uniref:Uncharacterized protein n=1 Tax=Bacillus mesophilum TaxID=1071718 RepID=A0A7V7RLH0_9BACI|nr:hypothetical protein [Bacillus mesophilum]KAB2332626.1 hypothetical protein F7732_11070 [Bacillus mesophilum]